ncbi:MAG: cytochrome c-type biogenesis protein CcmH [Alphaproteobacteria bacterium]|nr:cytochrome c-type biogenesis protein CcmH [Alphaproteobacteria bacterium]
MRHFLAIFAIVAAISAAGLVTGSPALAVEPDEVLADPVLEARARELSKVLRCVVCQNQSIDDSNADIARDMRLIVRERLVAGDTDDQTVAYMVARYGDYVLLRPPFQPNTMALWVGPPFMAMIIATLALLFFRMYQRERVASGSPEPLTPTDRAQLDALVDKLAAEPRRPRRQSGLRAELEQPFGSTGSGGNGSDNPAT